MSNEAAQPFIDALRRLEADGEVEPLVDLFADDGTCDNLTRPGAHEGADGARRFWSADRDLFATVTSEFRSVVVSGDAICLEWLRTGTAGDGDPVRYGGVSVIELRDGKIARFQAYYDPAALGAQTP